MINNENNIKTILESARLTIDTEIQGALKLSERLDEHFTGACLEILSAKGKIVVSGMGKSGHVGRKLAATLASTGTAAFYVHPSEALHGDLGMIEKGDVAILISYSGFAAEFRLIIPLLKELNVVIIAFTGNLESPLARAADYILNIYTEKEACPFGLAPTSSVVNTLILGDAMAISLMQARGFSESDYAKTHPAGSLGMRLLCRVVDIMRTEPKIPTIDESSTVKDAIFELTRTGLGFVSVLNKNGDIKGVFTDGDLRRLLQNEGSILSQMNEVMNESYFALNPMHLASEALAFFQEKKISSAPVVNEKNKVIGAINTHDIHGAGIFLT